MEEAPELDGLEVTRFPGDRPQSPAVPAPLKRWVDPERLGGALLITCECEDFQEKPDMDGFDALYTNPDLLVPGGEFRWEGKGFYREQSLLAAEMVADCLERIGVPSARIVHYDFTSGDASGPKEAVLGLVRRMPLHAPDILVYYVGPSLRGGAWSLGWRDADDKLVSATIDPEELLPPPGPGDGPPGLRLIVADAPDTARMWMRPASRLVGVAAWDGAGRPGGPAGPPLARWLTGHTLRAPDGVVTFDLPEDVELRRLPCYKPLFWGLELDAKPAGRLLWELQEFVGASTRRERQREANTELLARGGPQLLLMLLFMHGKRDEALSLQIIWLLHNLVLYAPAQRWAGTMDEALADVLEVPSGRAECSPESLAAVMGFVAACASCCPTCRAQCAGSRWPKVLALALRVLAGAGHAGAVSATCRAVAQVASVRVLEIEEHAELLQLLVQAILADHGSDADTGEVRQAGAEALLFMTLRCNGAKRAALATLGRSGRLPGVLAGAAPRAAAKLLALLRSLAAVEPSTEVRDGVDPNVVDSVVHCLCCHASDAPVQRWGLAALGSLAAASSKLAEAGADGGVTCVMWALGADVLAHAPEVEQEALFCAHALCGTAVGRSHLASPELHIAGLVGGAVARSVRRRPAHGEAAVWGLRFFERLARSKDTLPAAEPYIGIIVDALRAPGICVKAVAAAAGALSLLAAGSDTALERIGQVRVQLTKALHRRGREVAAADNWGELGRRQEKDLYDWANVLVSTLGEPEEPEEDPEFVFIPPEEEVFAFDLKKGGLRKPAEHGKKDKEPGSNRRHTIAGPSSEEMGKAALRGRRSTLMV